AALASTSAMELRNGAATAAPPNPRRNTLRWKVFVIVSSLGGKWTPRVRTGPGSSRLMGAGARTFNPRSRSVGLPGVHRTVGRRRRIGALSLGARRGGAHGRQQEHLDGPGAGDRRHP